MDYLKAIKIGKDANTPYNEIARKIFLTFPTHAFIGNEEHQYSVYNEISKFFDVPISSVHVAGSAKIGKSIHKGRDFEPGISDLDIAIIDVRLFLKYMEYVCKVSKNYTDLTRFPMVGITSTCESYLKYLSKGIFRPDLMVNGEKRAEINNFFGVLSSKYSGLFSSINAAVYMSEAFFENKQRSVITNVVKSGVY
ncbi:hypothetical protein ATI02_4932 [Pseudomonas baetica]|uniref:Polymerase nucleotidyl transferase domain-containing protein n=1 Tax=Pseudomonas baetica TaxID=674054 RepID=A0ABX4Q555_9PSED|nr:hypothetical protein [Pseudomonas baetica]PKA71919.1 hypothetical protein ATI02_4932 [Pseudomonas baetica]PTC20381.1 hypothetical protein C0J26_10535 [Pseudomonas baetica]